MNLYYGISRFLQLEENLNWMHPAVKDDKKTTLSLGAVFMLDRVSGNLLQQHISILFHCWFKEKKKRDSVSQRNETPAACVCS